MKKKTKSKGRRLLLRHAELQRAQTIMREAQKQCGEAHDSFNKAAEEFVGLVKEYPNWDRGEASFFIFGKQIIEVVLSGDILIHEAES